MTELDENYLFTSSFKKIEKFEQQEDYRINYSNFYKLVEKEFTKFLENPCKIFNIKLCDDTESMKYLYEKIISYSYDLKLITYNDKKLFGNKINILMYNQIRKIVSKIINNMCRNTLADHQKFIKNKFDLNINTFTKLKNCDDFKFLSKSDNFEDIKKFEDCNNIIDIKIETDLLTKQIIQRCKMNSLYSLMRLNRETNGLSILTNSNDFNFINKECERLETLQKDRIGDPNYSLCSYFISDSLK